MKRVSFAALAAFFMLGSAQAQMQMPQWNPGGLYGELGYTFMKVDAFGTSLRPGVLRGVIGYEVHPYFAVEGMAGGGVKDNDKAVAGPTGALTTATVNVDYLFGLYLKPRYLINPQTELFGRVGWSRTKVKAERTGFVTRSEEQDDLGWGVGVNYRITPNWYVGADWMRYSSQSNTHADGITLTAGWHW
jgi:opacity protein-like surface antigen